MSGTASRSGYDSASEKFQGDMTEQAGKLTGDEAMEHKGKTQRAEAEAEEDEILEPWAREHPEDPATER